LLCKLLRGRPSLSSGGLADCVLGCGVCGVCPTWFASEATVAEWLAGFGGPDRVDSVEDFVRHLDEIGVGLAGGPGSNQGVSGCHQDHRGGIA